MEKPLDRQLEELMNTPGVTGVVCADSKGLCLAAKGVGERTAAGLFSSVTQQAGQLHPDIKTSPVVCLETDQSMILLKNHSSVTTAIHKALS
ncbi:Ragulator complex protein LAMTOR5 [Lamellibrachia satsuma]|nr:Ragulator complex protein LAMTOR5 [Lamellibrachia satsuma]